MTRLPLETGPDGRPRRLEYYFEGRRIAVETLDASGAIRLLEGRIPDGPVREYGEPEIMLAEISFRAGARNGPARYFYPDGALRAEVNWSDNREDGEARVYRADGSVAFLESYQQGVLTRRRHYDPRGNVVYDQGYPVSPD